jgi:hypothetical protein
MVSYLLYQDIDPELWRKYVARTGDGFFASTTPSQSKCRLPEAVADIDALLRQFCPTDAVQLDSYHLLERVFEEQCERIKQRARRLSEQSAAFRDQYRWRAGIEGTISRLKHQMGLAHLRVRGQGAVQYRVLRRALGLNIHRVAVWRGHFTLKNFLVCF